MPYLKIGPILNIYLQASAITIRRPTAPVIDSPSSVSSETNWNGVIPRVRRKWVDVVEGIINNFRFR